MSEEEAKRVAGRAGCGAVMGKKKLKAMDLTKAMIEKFGAEVDKKACKEAIRNLIDSGRCVYTYFGGSYVEIPPKE